jgi:fucose 4-O-acetylase-like acetyltransferase
MTTIDSVRPIAMLTSDAMLFFAPIFVAAALHPARGELLNVRGLSRENVSPTLLGLAALAVVPVALYAAGQLNFQQTLADEHAEFGHYATMVYYTLSLLGLASLASRRNRGRRFAAYGAGLLAVMFAIASVFNPTTSGLSSTWAAFAALWGVVFVGAYEWTVRRDAPVHEAVPSEDVPLAP